MTYSYAMRQSRLLQVAPVKAPSTTSLSPNYRGPGDIIPGAASWWGLRAYSSQTCGTPCIGLHRDSDNEHASFSTLATGDLDMVSILAFKGAANVFVHTMFDQSGNGNDLTNPVISEHPPFIFNAIGSRPAMQFDGLNTRFFSNIVLIGNVGTFSSVAFSTNNGLQQVLWLASGVGSVAFNAGGTNPNTVFVFQSINVTAPAADGSWHALQGVFNGASSDMNVNGVSTPGDDGTLPGNTTNDFIGEFSNSQFLLGQATEFGRWPFAFTPVQSANMSANQRGYWGF